MTLPLRRIDHGLLQDCDLVDGVLKASALGAAGEARDVIERARLEANRLLDTARTQAGEELQKERTRLEEQAWRSAAAYAQALQGEWDASLARLEDRVVSLLGRALRRLVEEVPAEDRLRACIRQLVEQGGAPDTGVLLTSAATYEVVQSLADRIPWPVESSDALPDGSVRLVAPQGRWECSLDTAIEQLMGAFASGRDEEGRHHA